MDCLTLEQRSRVMAAIRSKGNKSTEQALRYRLVRAGIRGWRMLDKDVLGKPDFIFDEAGLVLFVDGCYWHGCPKCYRAPASNQTYWSQKLIRNRGRDRFVGRELRRQGWTVVRIWEHELKLRPGAVVKKIQKLVSPPVKAFSAGAGRG